MDNSNQSIRFGLMINGLTVERWQYETIKLLIDNNIELALVVENDDKSTQLSICSKIKSYPYKRLIFRLWNRFLFKPKSKIPTNIEDLIAGKEVLKCKPINKGISTYFQEDDIETIKNHRLDFLLRLGFDIVRGEVLNAARYGIWSYHHDDERIIRGGPPGFWEFMRNIPSNGVILQKLTNDLDKGVIIKRIQLNTILHSYKAHLDQLYFEAEILPLQVCKDLLTNGNIVEIPSQSQAKIVYPPRNLKMLQYFWLSIWRRVNFHLKDLFRQEDWNVGYCMTSLEDFVNCKDRDKLDIQWFKKQRRSDYFADPFVISTKEDTYIFFEWYSYKKGKADLAVALKSEDFKNYHIILEDKIHHSYPYVFEYKNVIYCLPEANQSNKVTLYRFDEKNLKLERDADILEGFPIVDATLLQNDDKWYMFLVRQKYSHTHLEIYWADDLRGPYYAHLNNPVKIDCHSARPAGKPLQTPNSFFRLAQNCTAHYGQNVVFNEIIQLDESHFLEKENMIIYPLKNTPYNKGIHTLNSIESMTVFDGKRFVFTFHGFIQQLKQKIKH